MTQEMWKIPILYPKTSKELKTSDKILEKYNEQEVLYKKNYCYKFCSNHSKTTVLNPF